MAAKDTDDKQTNDQDADISLDMSQAAVKKMIAEARERGYITYDQLNTVLPPDQVSSEQIEDVIGIDASEALEVSAKSGLGIQETLEAIVEKLPPPKGDRNSPLKAMLVDSWYDAYLGVVVLVRIMDGVLGKGDKVKMFSNGSVHTVDRIGVFALKCRQLNN